jgi:hypothetical protein
MTLLNHYCKHTRFLLLSLNFIYNGCLIVLTYNELDHSLPACLRAGIN